MKIEIIKVVPFAAEHAVDIINRNRDMGKELPEKTVNEMLVAYLSPGSVALTLMCLHTPVMCGGIINLGWKRGEAWVLISSLFYKFRLSAFRELKKGIPTMAEKNGFCRVQAVSVTEENEKWFQCLGFEREGVLKAYGPANQDVIMYSRIFNKDAVKWN